MPLRAINWALMLLLALFLAGCNSGSDGATGAAGAAGTPGASTGTVAGTVTDSSGTAIAGATVTFAPLGTSVSSDSSGAYTASQLPDGVYTVTYSANGYTSVTATVSVLAGQTTSQDEALTATTTASSGPSVTATTSGSVTPGSAVTVSLTPSTGTITSVNWSVLSGPIDSNGAVSATVAAASDPSSATVQLPAITDYLNKYFDILKTQRGVVTATDSSGNATAFAGALINRNMVMGMDSQDVSAMSAVTLQAKVTLSTGDTLTKTVSLATDLSYTDQAGTSATFTNTTSLRNVPINVPVLLHGKDGVTGTWAVTAPSGSTVTKLQNADQQNAYFTPDVTGEYVVTAPDGTTIDLYAAKWGLNSGGSNYGGVIGGLDSNGNPTASSLCDGCHASAMPDWNTLFTDWSGSGHAHKFINGINGGGHYNNGCFQCHTVGYDTAADNGGIDDLANYDAMYNKYFPNNSPTANPDNFKNLLKDFPVVGSMTNIQCENCHGPNGQPGSGAHVDTTQAAGTSRIGLSSAVCGSCHGAPTHHPAYPLWQRSGHANVSLASQFGLETDTNGDYTCAGCHTAQGALAWIKQLNSGDPSHTFNATTMQSSWLANLTADTAQPQTCAVCHDPHDPGPSVADAKVRVEGSTPELPAGFKATGVGMGAICFICHNSRNGETASGNYGLHEDNDPYFGTLPSAQGYQVAHHSAQGDVLMGRNAYFVTGTRSPHSLIKNSCANCHMEKVTAPKDLAGSGASPNSPANHTFSVAWNGVGEDFCSSCHGSGFNREGLQSSVTDLKSKLAKVMLLKAIDLAKADTTDNSTITFPAFAATDSFTYDIDANTGTMTNANGDTAVFKINYSGPSLSITPAGAAAEAPVLPFDETLAKAVWNSSLISEDKSEGVHNPDFVQQVVTASIQQVQALP